MEKAEREKLAEMACELRDKIDFNDLKVELVKSQLFTVEMLADIENVGDGSSSVARNEELIRCIQKRGPQAYPKFVHCLIDSENLDAARILEPNIPESGVWLDKITPAAHWPRTSPVYRMASKCRGVALILSITEYENNVYSERKGGEIDGVNLQRLFSDLGFDVDFHSNKNRMDIRKIFNDFRKDRRHAAADACIVVTMSHGKDGAFYSADGLEIGNGYVLDSLNNRNCPMLHRKPKIFFFIQCRGDKIDNGFTDGTDSVPISKSDKNLVKGGSLPTSSDTKIIYSTCPAYTSMRNRKQGAYFVSIFMEICCKHAHDTDLNTMLSEISSRLTDLEIRGNKQTPEYIERGWRFLLYFNPGLYKLEACDSYC